MTVIRAIVTPGGQPTIVDLSSYALETETRYQVPGGVSRTSA